MLPIRSINDNEPAYIQLQNKTARNIDIIWINYMGKFVKYGALGPQENINVDTFKTHPWMFIDRKTGVKMAVGSKTIFYPLSSRVVMQRLGLNPEENIRVPVPIRLPLFSLRHISLQKVFNLLRDINEVEELDLPFTLKRDILRLSHEKNFVLSLYDGEWTVAVAEFGVARVVVFILEKV